MAAAPIKTEKGWILIYHGVSKKDNKYKMGAMLLNLKDPTKVVKRLDYPIFVPQRNDGRIIFPCGTAVIKDKLFVYYGSNDKTLKVATIGLNDLLKSLTP